MKTLLLLFLAGLLALYSSGCATVKKGSDVTGLARTSPLSGRDLGRLIILARVVKGENAPNAAEKEITAQDAATTVLTSQATAVPVPRDGLLAALGERSWPDAGDVELAAAARACGVDTVAVLTVTEYVGKLHLGLPTLWGTETAFRYQLRLLDAATGTLLLDANRFRLRGGPFLCRGLDDLNADFQNDLIELVRGDPAAS